MLCKGCKTAIVESDKICGYCGAPVKRSNNFWLIYLLFAFIIMLMFFSLNYVFKEREPEREFSENSRGSDLRFDIPYNRDQSSSAVATEKPTATPFMAFDSDDDKDDVIAIAENIAKAASAYVSEGTEYIYFLSKNGYLYDAVNEKYIVLADLTNIKDFNREYENENVLLLYLRKREFAATSDDTSEESLEVFCAYETMRGFYIASPGGYIGIITRESLRELLLKYSQENGEIIRFSPDSEEFKAIALAIQDYLDNHSEINIRYLAGDNRSAFAVVSFKGQDNIIKEYALRYREEQWSVFSAGFEELYEYKTVINVARPSFNINIFPDYSFYFFNKYIRSDFSDIINKLIEGSYITINDSPPVFASGTDLFSYFEFPSGRKILCYTPPSIDISVYPISNYLEGESIMRVLSKDAPLFILKQH